MISSSVFVDNFDALTSYYDKVIAVDWLGMGSSSRTSTRVTRLSLIESMTKCATKEEHEKEVAKQVTDEFIDSLEDLRKQEKIENFVLAGHSLGGYLVGKYALKYPKEVKGLILISPVGIPEQPAKEDRVDPAAIDWRINFMAKLWNFNITPQSLIRVMGSRGPELVENFIGRRFSQRWSGDELKYISDYFYHITAAPGNGEYALNALLEPIFVKNQSKSNRSPRQSSKKGGEEEDNEDKLNERRKGGYRTGVFAKNPLENELSTVKFPILLVYGDNDWLYYPGASNSIDMWKNAGINAKLAIISNAGHHLYLENSEDFNQLLIEWTRSIRYKESLAENK